MLHKKFLKYSPQTKNLLHIQLFVIIIDKFSDCSSLQTKQFLFHATYNMNVKVSIFQHRGPWSSKNIWLEFNYSFSHIVSSYSLY